MVRLRIPTSDFRLPTSPPRQRAAFTLLEAVIASTLTALAGSALLLGLTSSLQNTDDILNEVIARGITEQLMDEVVGKRYSAPGAGGYQVGLGPNTSETSGPGRSRYDDIDDYAGYTSQPATDPYAIALGTENGTGGTRPAAFQISPTYFSRWRETIDVYYVSNTNFSQRLSGSQTSDYRAVEIHVYYDDPQSGSRELASLRRIVSYLPNPQ